MSDQHIYGSVTVNTKWQIIIPKEARDIFNIKSGDSLLVLGDESQGIAIVKNEVLQNFANDILNAKEKEEW